MIDSFYTLRALAEAWDERLAGTTLADAYSQEAGELTLAFEGDTPGSNAQSVRLGVRRPLLFAFRTEGAAKARRNVATLFEAAHGRRVEAVRTAQRDRHFFFDLEGGLFFQVPLFGARANVFLVRTGPGEATEDETGSIVEAFRGHEAHAGEAPPAPQPAPMPGDFDAFEARWRPERNALRQAVSGAFALFGPLLAEETITRAGVDKGSPAACTRAERQRLFEAAQALRRELRAAPRPRLYASGWEAGTFALVPMRHRETGSGAQRTETFDDLDVAVRAWVRRRLAERRYEELREPLEGALQRAAERQTRTIESLEGQLKGTPRADRYERYGHLLKAQAHAVAPGADEATLSDYFAEAPADGEDDALPTVTIPLQPERTAIENAERYYDKAQSARTERQKATERLAQARRDHRRAGHLLGKLRSAKTLDALRRFRREHAEALAAYTASEGGTEDDAARFRRFPLKDGYEILAGKNARQNHDLTFHRAQKYDLWLHARRVPGAHVVLRLPSRDAVPPRAFVQAAAGVAAYYSKARTSQLVPVMVTERKYVRSPSGAPPGQVRVEHEEVVMATPRLP